METKININYDTIIKFLCKHNENLFLAKESIQKNIDDGSDFTSDFKEFSRFGIHQKFKNKYFYGLFSSILFLFDDNYILKNTHEKTLYVELFINELRQQWNLNSKKTREPILQEFKNYCENNKFDIDKLIIFLQFCLKTNIIIVDFKNKKLISSDKFNTYYPFIIISKYDKYYEPIIREEHKYFKFKDINKILGDHIKKNNISLNITKNRESLIKKYLGKEFIKQKIGVTDKSEPTTETKLKADIDLNKKLKKDLIEILKQNNIEFKIKDTKKILIEKINNLILK